MAQGIIKSLRTMQGFGFIAPDEGKGDVFFDRNVVEGDHEGDHFGALREGQRVEYEQRPDPRDPRRNRATSVRLARG